MVFWSIVCVFVLVLVCRRSGTRQLGLTNDTHDWVELLSVRLFLSLRVSLLGWLFITVLLTSNACVYVLWFGVMSECVTAVASQQCTYILVFFKVPSGAWLMLQSCFQR